MFFYTYKTTNKKNGMKFTREHKNNLSLSLKRAWIKRRLRSKNV